MALRLPISMVNAYFESPVFEQDIKSLDIEQRNQAAVIDRLNSVIKAIGLLGKAIAGRR